MGDILKLGHLYRDKYHQGKRVGRGGFGTVYNVTSRTGEVLAAKHIKFKDEREQMRAISEVNILSGLESEFIIKFIESFKCLGKIVVVMEYLEGGELLQGLADHETRLLESDCCLYMRQILRGLEYLHLRNIVHLDIKPENIMCTEKGGKTVKIVDFGTAVQLQPGKKPENIAGTPDFMAPEVVDFEQIYTETDMWSVGVLCFVLLSGYSPFLGENINASMSNVTLAKYTFDNEEFNKISPSAKDLITRLLRRSPNQRLSARDCLEHSWLEEKNILRKTRSIDLDNLRQFLAKRKVQNVAMACRVINILKGNVRERQSGNHSQSESSHYNQQNSLDIISEEQNYGFKELNKQCSIPTIEREDSIEEEDDEILAECVCQESYDQNKNHSILNTESFWKEDEEILSENVTPNVYSGVIHLLRKEEQISFGEQNHTTKSDGNCQEKAASSETVTENIKSVTPPAPRRITHLLGKYKRTSTKAAPGTVKTRITDYKKVSNDIVTVVRESDIKETHEDTTERKFHNADTHQTMSFQEEDVSDVKNVDVPEYNPSMAATNLNELPGRYKRTSTKPAPGTVKNRINEYKNISPEKVAVVRQPYSKEENKDAEEIKANYKGANKIHIFQEEDKSDIRVTDVAEFIPSPAPRKKNQINGRYTRTSTKPVPGTVKNRIDDFKRLSLEVGAETNQRTTDYQINNTEAQTTRRLQKEDVSVTSVKEEIKYIPFPCSKRKNELH